MTLNPPEVTLNSSQLIFAQCLAMSRLALLSCLLAACLADPVPPQQDLVINCANIKPLTDLDVNQMKADWVAVALLAFDDGVEKKAPPGFEDAVFYSDKCFHFRVPDNATQNSVTMLGSLEEPSKSKLSRQETNYLVSEREKGRWTETSDLPEHQKDLYLVIAADPARYAVLVSCSPKEGDTAADADRFPDFVMVLSRYTSRLGRILVTEEEFGDINVEVARIVGLPKYNPVITSTSCFDDFAD